MPRKPSPEVLAARYAAARARMERAKAAHARAADAMQAAAIAAVPPPPDTGAFARGHYRQYVYARCYGYDYCGDYPTLHELVAELRAYWAKELSEA